MLVQQIFHIMLFSIHYNHVHLCDYLVLLAGQMEVAYVIPVLFLSNSLGTPLLPKTIEIQDFEMALSNADNKELLQKWYKLDGHAQPPCYRLQPIASHIPGFKVWNNIYVLYQNIGNPK